ncbi:MAG: zinc ribbon domain-containing protein, partial [Verrucomicrobiota bacterium]
MAHILIAMIPAAIASHKGRSFLGWWFYGLLIWPITLIHALLIGPTDKVRELRLVAAGNLK